MRSGDADEADPDETAASESSDKKGSGDSDEDSDSEDEAIPVEAVALERGRIESVLSFSTNLEAEGEVQVFSEANRRIKQLLVEEGDRVRQGQVLVRLQDEAQRTALARAESQVEKARRDYERQTELHDEQLISEEIYLEATYNLEQLELALEDAKRELGYTEVRAPIAGTITERLVNVGDQVTVNQHLFDIVDFDSIIARIYVPEKELVRVREGLDARIIAAAVGGEPHQGTVDRIAPRVDPRSAP